MLLEDLKKFCNQTSIHGLGQIANDQTPVIKRSLWIVIFACSLAYAGEQLASTIVGKLSEDTDMYDQKMGYVTKYPIF